MRLRTPALSPEGPRWATMRDHLVERLPRVDPSRIDAMLREERIVDRRGPLAPDAPFVPEEFLWFHRDLPDEAPVPFEIGIVHRDDHLLVVDKPHFLATIPRGSHILETALVRLRRELDLPTLSPAHRLDRPTAGLLMFVVHRERRGAYQTLFRDRHVRKTYEAVARYDPALALPRTVRSRIVKDRGVIRAYEEAGPVNAITHVELLAHRDGLARYRLLPETGRTHQLRVHMNGLDVPILGDDFFPVLTEKPLDDFSRPLQLLASSLEFRDPFSGALRRFTTRLELQAWTSYEEWASARTEGRT
ncbi:RluA family pseudouridine synthase [Pseudonocardia adelaidensis]|uniref:RNA pseudouridylate synthase n=1 Tax=Pseudonocardia adelaidensis TaxID=648754 RepID=A0ABP9NV64_9PSEU